MLGQTVSHYRIEEKVGHGGMGEVYRARDLQLHRAAAIKVLRPEVASNERRRRFKQEVFCASSLNHPNILSVYEAGSVGDQAYLITEFVDGGTLRDWVAREQPTVQQSLEIMTGIADALACAHEAGIVHRDIKPENILVARHGYAKLSDFGVAKLMDPETFEPPTLHATEPVRTRAGAAVGTVAYMAPEQLSGKSVDARADVFSFGVVLYELLAERRPFAGATDVELIASIRHGAPRPLPQMRPEIPVEVWLLVDKALEKEPGERYQSMRELVVDLKRVQRLKGSEIARVSGEVPAAAVRASTTAVIHERRRIALGVAGLVVALLAAVWTALHFSNKPVTSPSEYVQLTDFPDSVVDPSLSPDGRMVTFIRTGSESFPRVGEIYIKLLPGGESVRLTNGEAKHAKYAPVFTPDGSRVAYTHIAARDDGRLSWDTWTVPIGGGEPTRILPNASGLVWTDPQHVLFSKIKGPGLHMGVVTATTGRAGEREIYFPDHERAMAHYSYLSPDRRSVLIVEMDRTAVFQSCRLTPFDGSSPGRQVGPVGTCTAAAWSPDGKWMYFSVAVGGESHLWRQRFPDGEPEQITFGPAEESGVAVEPDGRSLLASVGQQRSAIWIHDSAGERQVTTEGVATAPQLSGDGRRLYYLLRQNSIDAPLAELRSVELASGRTDRPLPDLSVTQYVVSNDEREIAFTTRGVDGVSEIWVAMLDRSSAPRRIVRNGDQVSFGAGADLIFRSLQERTNFLSRIRKDGSALTRVIDTPISGKFDASPDGAWVFVRAPATGETLAVPLLGGAARRVCDFCEGRWSSNGRWLYVDIPSRRDESPRTLAIPVRPTAMLSESLTSMVQAAATGTAPAETRILEHGPLHVPTGFPLVTLAPGPDPSVYAFVKRDAQRNLFRIPLH